MTSDRDPPRLRRLGGELPAELSLAIAESQDERPTSAELAALAGRIRSALAEAEEIPRYSRFVPRRRAARGGIVALVLTFTVGAGAGVLVSSGIFVVSRSRTVEPAPQAVATTTAQPHVTRRSETPEPSSAPLEPPAAPTPALRDTGHFSAPGAVNDSESSPRGTDRDELALVARAQGALASSPGLALALASDHERKFPHGALVQEREVVAIDALIRLGRSSEAKRRAVQFHRDFPASVHGRRLDVLLGSDPAGESHN